MAFDKEEYWKRRNNATEVKVDGEKVKIPKPLRGQGEVKKPKVLPNENDKAERGFGNNGEIIVKNRQYRRRKLTLPGSSIFTKTTVLPRRLAEHRKNQARNKRRVARKIKKEMALNGR